MNAAGNFMLVVASTQGIIIIGATDSESHINEAGIIAMINSGVVALLLIAITSQPYNADGSDRDIMTSQQKMARSRYLPSSFILSPLLISMTMPVIG